MTTIDPPPMAGQYDLIFWGSSLDDRGDAAKAHCRTSGARCCELRFESDTRQFLVDGQAIRSNQLEGMFGDAVLIEATTLGVAEICGILRSAFRRELKQIDFLYVEPDDYTRGEAYGNSGLRSFKLSENRQFVGIPGYSIDTSQYTTGKAVFFLGYEGERLSQALEQMELDGWEKIAVFGIPAYQAGWEMNALANNVTFLKNCDFYESRYAAASSVQAAFDLLSKLHLGSDDPDLPTVIAPLGTKPHSIGCALFVAFHASFNTAGLVFDHPVKADKRSTGTNRWHLIQVHFQW